ncbi:cytochrome P450 [Nocardia sp. NPDC046473]|uniref:cytochrome P450 n=1 Tax=Nocardia sp. NPDC046473 TaxID=3155733 RepID=UPI0033C70C91
MIENNGEKSACPRFPFGPRRPVELEPEFAQLRREAPVSRVELPYGGQAWLLTRMTETKAMLNDTRLSRKAMQGDRPRLTKQQLVDLGDLAMMEPAAHTRARRLIVQAFRKCPAEGMRREVTEIVDDLLDRMMVKGPTGDLAADFASLLPSRVICLLLGVPYEDWDKLGGYIRTLVMQDANTGGNAATSAMFSMISYFASLIAARRREPGDDLISALLQATNGDDAFTDEEVKMHAVTIFIAGYETTSCQIVNSVCALLKHPDKLKWLQENPDAMPNAVEELLRYAPLTDAAMPQVATEDLELGGVTIRKGEVVIPSPVSANHDEAVFERADELDLRRGSELNQHVAFGHGSRYCIGAPIARLELQVALGAIFRRMPDISLAVPEEELRLKSALAIRGFDHFPINW